MDLYKQTLRLIRTHYMYNADIDYTDIITDVKFEEKDNEYVVTIITHRPGLIIGYHGKDIDNLTAYLNRFKDVYDKPITVKIDECKLWSDIYE